MADKSPVARQSISMPAGGGDIRGLGETFQPDLNSGVGNYRVALDLLPGVRNFQPNLSLNYSTGAKNGPWGLGWSVPFAAISRRTFRGTPSYTDEDTFLFCGQNELLPVGGNCWRASVENGFEQFQRTVSGWQVTEKSGIRHWFGTTANSRIEFDDGGATKVLAWLVDRTEDTTGNAITYTYRAEGSQRHIEEICYAAYVVRFYYEPRPDPFSDFRGGFELKTALRCTRINLRVPTLGSEPVRVWDLSYQAEPLSGLSLLHSVVSSGYRADSGESASLPPLTFSYTEFTSGRARLRKFIASKGAPPPALDQSSAELIDLEGCGLPGILSIANGLASYWPNRGAATWDPPRTLPRFPAPFSSGDERVFFADMDGNGAADVLLASGTLSGFYPNDGKGGFGQPVKYARRPAFAFEGRGMLLLDVDGDGMVDAVRDGRTGLQMYRNRGSEGWDPPVLVPRDPLANPVPDLSSADPRVRLADMNGDGLADVVMFTAGHLEYWPARGAGRFAESREMATPPRFPYPFDPRRVFLTDVNGDGLADVIYAGYDEITIWINQSGNSFGPPQTVSCTPPTTRTDTLRLADMTGSGVAGLLWTGPYADYRYLDFIGGAKPALLSHIDNGLGRISTIEYSTSADEARRDRLQGEPWTSFLPFPVQVVTSVTVDDAVSGLHTVIRYRYHEGHYDGHRREFDGFGWSEQIEEGDASIATSRTVFHFHTEASGQALFPDPEFRRTLKRKLSRVDVYGEDSSPLAPLPYRIEESDWTVRVEQTLPDGRRSLFPFVQEATTSTFERQLQARVERRIFSFDSSGNVTTEERRGEGGAGPSLAITTCVEYAQDPAGRVRDRISRIAQRGAGDVLLNETRRYYDGPAFIGLPLGQVAEGLLRRTEKVVLLKSAAATAYSSSLPDFAALHYRSGQDWDGNPVWVCDTERFQHGSFGNVMVSRNARGNDITYTYDAFGLFSTSRTDAKGFTATVEHDLAAGKPRRLVNPNGGVTECKYEPLGRVAAVAWPGDTLAFPTASYAYQTRTIPAMRATRYRPVSGETRTIAVNEFLDGAGAVFQRRTEHDGLRVSVTGQTLLNSRGKTAAKFDPFYAQGLDFVPYSAVPATPARTFFFDALGRSIQTVHPDGGCSTANYGPFDALFSNAGDNDSSEPVSFGTPRREIYDAWCRLTAVEELDTTSTRTTTYEVDTTGQLVGITDSRGLSLSRITRDLLGQEIRIDHLDAGTRLLAYDACGNLAMQVDAAGRAILRQYDELNRPLETTYSGSAQEKYFYDTGAGANLKGRLARVIDPAGETAYSYDGLGNTIERSRLAPGSPSPIVLGYAFDRIGRMTRLSYPDGSTTIPEHYSGFLMRGIPGVINAIEYNAAGARIAIDYASGVRTTFNYDPATTRLREIRTFRPDTGTTYFHNRYEINKAGDLASIQDLRAGPLAFDRSQTFGYDALGNMTGTVSLDPAAGYTHAFEYDTVGNFARNPLIAPHPLIYENVGASNRLSGYDTGASQVTLFQHDQNGNLTLMPGRTLTYDAKQQLARVQMASGVDVMYFYDNRGVLSRRETVQAGVTHVTHYADNLFESTPGGPTLRWIFAGDLPVACVSSGGMVFIHNDHLGSAAVYTDAGGNLLAESALHPFGRSVLTPAGALPPLFATKRFDPEVGLYYFNARWYSPDIGRFLSPDPLFLFQPDQGIQDPRRLNPYVYAGNNPVRYVDPTGLGFWDILGAIVAVIAIAVATVFTAGAVAAVGLGAVLAWGALAGVAGAAVGALVGGIAYGSWDGALRGAMIGFAAGANFMIGGMIFGPLIGAALGIITFLSVIPEVAHSDIYQGILGWTSYFMPMSWPGHALGLTMFALNVAGYLVTFGQSDKLRIRDMVVDWKTGNIFTVGGWVGQLTPRAFNFGAFSFVNTSRYVNGEIAQDTFEHESGHMLSNAAFGFLQASRVFEGDNVDSFWERIAESNVPSGLRAHDPLTPEPDRPKLPQWA